MKRKRTESAYRWLCEPRWLLWEGGFLLVGRAEGVVPAHAHHAIQIVVALDGQVAICGNDDRWIREQGVFAQPNIVHSFDCCGSMGAMLFVDPESKEGVWLRRGLGAGVGSIPDFRLVSCITQLQSLINHKIEVVELGQSIRDCVHGLLPGTPPSRKQDDRISLVLSAIRSRDDLHLSLEEAANMAFLSSGRFSHLFKEQVGLSFSRYMLWRKLTRAMVALATEKTISAAAHAADFADSAHLTRTFHQMLGMAPSALMRGSFEQIPSPFGEPDRS